MKQMLPQITPDHTVQNLLFLLNAFLTSEGETLGLMLEFPASGKEADFRQETTWEPEFVL